MSDDIPKSGTIKRTVPSGHLSDIVASMSQQNSTFSIFLGAGASIQSGIPLASNLIKHWREIFYQRFGEKQDKDKFLASHSWFGSPDEYGVLFELLYDTASQRRQYIETEIESCLPSIGYVYLVGLLEKGVFNTVFTTNFDDLLNESCYMFSSHLRPVVCAHDSSLEFIRLSSTRPKIIKVHGDFLFDNIKNTVRETESLGENTLEKLSQISREGGMIVVGYSGCDRSVMDAFRVLLSRRDAFPHGVYWCTTTGRLSERVLAIERDERVRTVSVSSFDELMAEFYYKVSSEPNPYFQDPLSVMRNRSFKLFDHFRQPIGLHDSRIAEDLANLAQGLMSPPPTSILDHVPMAYLQQAAIGRADFKLAKKLIQQKPLSTLSSPDIFAAIEILEKQWDLDFAKWVLEHITTVAHIENAGLPLAYFKVALKNQHFDFAKICLDFGYSSGQIDEHILIINQCILARLSASNLDGGQKRVLKKIEKRRSLPRYVRIVVRLLLQPDTKLTKPELELLTDTPAELILS